MKSALIVFALSLTCEFIIPQYTAKLPAGQGRTCIHRQFLAHERAPSLVEHKYDSTASVLHPFRKREFAFLKQGHRCQING